MIRLAIFASGNGTNAENIIRYFAGHSWISVALIVSSNKNAFVLQRAVNHYIPSETINTPELNDENGIINIMESHQIDYIILAGFLKKIPGFLIAKYQKKILNIHPALLPKYGGKGMYGMHIHETIINNDEKESGITIHFVNEKYDEGEVILQVPCEIDEGETAESLAKKVHTLEYEYFPKTIEQVIFPNQ